MLDKSIVVFTADHGEEFREHGQLAHGTSLYNELIRVPLIVLVPGQRGGRVVRDNVSLVDVAPTLLALLGLPPEPRFEGRSLVPLLTGDAPAADVVAELPPISSSPLDLGRHSLAFVRGSVKLVLPRKTGYAKTRPMLFDLATDPRETRPDPPETAALAGRFVRTARAVGRALVARATPPERGVVDETSRQRLRALGYAN